ncbi:SDR family NAD(P)-dependent oxidoreductase [Methanonatronarchaeum sp. AMET6-2]|uniref:SDR family NAD(P)-dependent oxidoreductase n=1 Tax=Methanonatronarchaeum sp. AMET6-2 TaxID=2933293 RepID=UPI001FF1D950|nr:SDR family NAD(P)-dependent oxidoreductase [Methanonatronarchaeum sp. AMET6-2]UOY10111.1 SDR family NAD(P)-dependent oxidoreductase [Methanonatronarchaeum sp. AMET6-2]
MKKPEDNLKNHNLKKLEGQKIFLTGATGGIGSETAITLSHHNVQLILHGRKQKKLDKLKKQLENPEKTILLKADFSNLTSVQKISREIKEKTEKLDGLINNAGIYYRGKKTAKNGLEYTFTVNHLAPALITQELKPLLQKTKEPTIINVASEAHRGTKKLALNEVENPENGWKAYSRSKLYNITYTKKLARQNEDTTYKAVHPGAVAGTRLFRNLPTPLDKITQIPKHLPMPFITKTPEAAATIINAYLDQKNPTGTYYDKFKPKKPSKTARNPMNQNKLWNYTQEKIEKTTQT